MAVAASPRHDAGRIYSDRHFNGALAMNRYRLTNRLGLPLVLIALTLGLAACNASRQASQTASSSTQPSPTAEAKPVEPRVGMANPASVHCTTLGGKLEIRTGKDGGQYGLCNLPDGRVCEEWALFRDGKCEKPAE